MMPPDQHPLAKLAREIVAEEDALTPKHGGTVMEPALIAIVCHEANRAYCAGIGDLSQPVWAEAPQWQRDSAINGVEFHMDNPDADPAHSHENWLAEKEKDGWVYGEVKDEVTRTHPCILPYLELPLEQQIKDSLFIAIVHALS